MDESGNEGNGSNGVSICGVLVCFTCTSGIMNDTRLHLLFSDVDSTFEPFAGSSNFEPLFDSSLDDSFEVEPSEPLSLELSLFGDAFL